MRNIVSSFRYPTWYTENLKYGEMLAAKFNCMVDGSKTDLKTINYVALHAFSAVKHRAVVSYTTSATESLYLYDFDKNEAYHLNDKGFVCSVCVCDWNSWHNGIKNIGFIRFLGDDDKVIILDGNFNNAPNLTGNDSFDVHFNYDATIINDDRLHFSYNGEYYFITEDYDLIAKFPKPLVTDETSCYMEDNTKQFYLQKSGQYCVLYDIDTKTVVHDDIRYIGYHGYDFVTFSGDIYKYNKESGKFELSVLHDKYIDKMSLATVVIMGRKYYSNLVYASDNVVFIYEDIKGKFYIVHNGKVVNKKYPIDKCEVITEDNDTMIKCIVNGIVDIYDSYDHFKFGTVKLSEHKKLWFEK